MYPKWRGLCGILTLAASLAIMGCGNGDTSNVRAVNASPGFAPFTYQVAQIGIVAALPYGTEGVQPKANYSTDDTSGAYRIVGTGSNQLVTTYATPGTTLASTKQTMVKNGYYTIVSIGNSPTMGLAVLTDNDTAPPSGQYNLRFLNYSGQAAVDVYITPVGQAPTGTPVIGNVGFNQTPGYLPLPPGTLEMQITPAGSTQVLASIPFSPAAGSIYSAFFMDPAPGSSAYILLQVNDPVAAATTAK